jgi:hypothetical protein
MLRTPLLAAGLTLAMAPAADAMIQIDRGIAGARLGNSKAEVRAALGTPARVVTGSNDFGPFTEFRYRGKLRVTFQGNTEVTGVSTTGLGDRTARGVGVGSREAAVKQKVPGVTCSTIAGFRSCDTKQGLPGQRLTSFRIKNGRVTRVTVAIVID